MVKSIRPADISRKPIVIETPKAGEVPAHLLKMPEGGWGLWRWAVLRGAGFPVTGVTGLSSETCAGSADQLIGARRNVEQGRERLLEVLRQGLEQTDKIGRIGLVEAIRRVKKGKPVSLDGCPEVNGAAKALSESIEQEERLREKYREQYFEAVGNTSKAIETAARSDRFREALVWQNRRALHTAIGPLLRKSEQDCSRGTVQRQHKQRQHEELVASYLQRYCLKNDTIGFFGPVGWARLVEEGEPIKLNAGPDFLAARNVYFEGWCLDALAEVLGRDKELRKWVPPRLLPFGYIESATLHLPLRKPIKLALHQAALLESCDGERTARDIAQHMIKTAVEEFKGEQDVYHMLESLHELGVISWKLEAPWSVRDRSEWHIEKNLRRAIDRIQDEELWKVAAGSLDELERKRDEVAQASGDAQRLDEALADLEATFTRLTGAASTRADGETYAGRTLVFEDCRRGVEVLLGPEVINALTKPLSLLLASARWFTYEVARGYRALFGDLYAGLARASGSSIVSAVSFWQKAHASLMGEHSEIVESVGREFRSRWAKVLGIDAWREVENAWQVDYTSEELSRRVEELFSAPAPGWPMARYHSPDLMLAAKDLEAVGRGEYKLVLGELHLGTNTMNSFLFQAQHPNPDEIQRAVNFDLPEIRLVPIVSKRMVTSRHFPVFGSDKDYRLEFSLDACDPGSQVLPIGGLVVEDDGGSLVVRTRDGRLRFDIVEALGDVLSNRVANHFKILNRGRHSPRISFDKFVISRETWNLPATEMSFALEKCETERFIAARLWAQQVRVPRFVFIKMAIEKKPFYVDFASPIYVDIFAKMIRRMLAVGDEEALVSITEMLPDADQSWLEYAGNSYASEFRIIAKDMLA